eukprot:CAMPEP_0197451738 /NCGR_PEP_ID=MMETSP1175-20131217/29969_1 /TAXON_ID=1003142 /ORGANISM="Triceratium dubium, Strain CCMP147" /LENGTH=64 /DNA_ID=CAMNT_0042984561 /DNA_START=175 /DNA_END=366 /DNA_ORIENTATION=+
MKELIHVAGTIYSDLAGIHTAAPEQTAATHRTIEREEGDGVDVVLPHRVFVALPNVGLVLVAVQ